ncbi:MAG TPA: hypothetical protein VL485_19865 [Ktedonobacteraceae bacterium]|nr:hypothetical protein [Ktedonobacteraceae bacterium]
MRTLSSRAVSFLARWLVLVWWRLGSVAWRGAERRSPYRRGEPTRSKLPLSQFPLSLLLVSLWQRRLRRGCWE